ncbi:nucleotidyltransferase family protein [Vampirovibrio sp.]|uniref:nucleotidyltransferase family protein n=1 Tax=Vampirovibrio sp. TaxID=2717857 RepID=UPI0035948017
MRFGLPDLTIEQIRSCFAQYPDIEWVKVYGSRSLGTHQPGSDVDLVYAGPVDHSAKLSSYLEEALTPYLFDVTYYNDLQSENLKSHIDRVGQFLFTQEDLKLANRKD